MERRLLIARELLNPTKSVLIVTIDEKEYLRLGILLEQLFLDARIQMVSSVINPKGLLGLPLLDEPTNMYTSLCLEVQHPIQSHWEASGRLSKTAVLEVCVGPNYSGLAPTLAARTGPISFILFS
ncbi:hypothetical protein [Frigidibacter mobilis]|uniref:hypothetical protein n=1 Tax=Frigidibacter mobilis TaxID=1335048 RepID=UPI00157C7E5F|nr:hypothetical protein [Frigidibacter mobilis]